MFVWKKMDGVTRSSPCSTWSYSGAIFGSSFSLVFTIFINQGPFAETTSLPSCPMHTPSRDVLFGVL